MKSFTYLDPLWFCMYANKDNERKASVLSWIKKKDIFSKKYVFVPIVMGYVILEKLIIKTRVCVVILSRFGRSHWSLLIFCNLGESVSCMLLLDSLQATGSTELKRYIRRYNYLLIFIFLINIYVASFSWHWPLYLAIDNLIYCSFLIGIYESEERPETRKQLSKIPFLIPKVVAFTFVLGIIS